jgi:flagellar assembly factor FliW
MPDAARLFLNTVSLSFPDGLNGLSEYKHFKLVQTIEMMPIALLHCMDEERISFTVADPGTWFPFFKIEINPEELKMLKAEKIEDILVLAIINVEAEPFNVTANLLAPLIINPTSGLGLQKLQENSPYLARHPLTLKTNKIFMPEGLLGIPEYKNFILHTSEELAPIQLLVCKDEPHLSFPIVDPFLIDQNYKPTLTQENSDLLEVNNNEDIEWRVMLRVINEPFQVTANMMAPLAIQQKMGHARQIVLSGSGYETAFTIQSLDVDNLIL